MSVGTLVLTSTGLKTNIIALRTANTTPKCWIVFHTTMDMQYQFRDIQSFNKKTKKIKHLLNNCLI